MGENTRISWTDNTYNHWIGCTKVSPGCAHCYAERENSRFGWNKNGWGDRAARHLTSATNRNKPHAWDRKAQRDGTRPFVFCQSLSDVFDPHPSILPEWREELFSTIEVTRNLTWLLLTKRPENVMQMISDATGADAGEWFAENSHVWIGATVEDRKAANVRIPVLLDVPAAVRFVSIEPMLEEIDLSYIHTDSGVFGEMCALTGWAARGPVDWCDQFHGLPSVNWVIAGCESGPGARPMSPDWVRLLRDQCVIAGVPFFFKQAMIGGRLVREPELDGRQWLQVPEVVAPEHQDGAQ